MKLLNYNQKNNKIFFREYNTSKEDLNKTIKREKILSYILISLSLVKLFYILLYSYINSYNLTVVKILFSFGIVYIFIIIKLAKEYL